MKKEWNPQDYPLYRNANVSGSTFFSSKLAKTITDELANNEEYAFLRDGSEFEELIAQLKDEIMLPKILQPLSIFLRGEEL